MMRNCVNHWILNRDSPNMLCIKNTFPPKLDMWICTAHFTRANFGSKTTFDRIFASKLEKYHESIKIVKATKLNFTKTNYVNELQQSLCIHNAASIFSQSSLNQIHSDIYNMWPTDFLHFCINSLTLKAHWHFIIVIAASTECKPYVFCPCLWPYPWHEHIICICWHWIDLARQL